MIYKLKPSEITKKTMIVVDYDILDDSGAVQHQETMYFNEDVPASYIEKELTRLLMEYEDSKNSVVTTPKDVNAELLGLKNKFYERKN